jgi:hypothetical protein
MHHNVIHALASARQRATRAWSSGVTGGLLALSLALTITSCQRAESTITALDHAATARIGVMGGGTLRAILPGGSDPHDVMAAALGTTEKGAV